MQSTSTNITIGLILNGIIHRLELIEDGTRDDNTSSQLKDLNEDIFWIINETFGQAGG